MMPRFLTIILSSIRHSEPDQKDTLSQKSLSIFKNPVILSGGEATRSLCSKSSTRAQSKDLAAFSTCPRNELGSLPEMHRTARGLETAVRFFVLNTNPEISHEHL
jgi:hypothetical protein